MTRDRLNVLLAFVLVAGVSCTPSTDPPASGDDEKRFRIAFAGDGACNGWGLSIISEDSSSVRHLLCLSVRRPNWTPTGAKIVFIEANSWSIMVCDVAAGTATTLLDLSGKVNGITCLDLSPDGRTALFAVDGSIGGVLYTIDIITGDTVSIRHGLEPPTFAWVRQAQWSPNGQRILFLADYRAWTIDAGGGDLRPVTDSLEQCLDISWSPSGDRISATTSMPGAFEEIYTILPDGTGRVNISRNAASDREARWSPDGTRLAYVSVRSDTSRLVVCNADGSDLRSVCGSPEREQYAWSPDGHRIALMKYVSTTIGLRQQLVMVNVDNLTSKHMVDTRDAWWPAWSPVRL